MFAFTSERAGDGEVVQQKSNIKYCSTALQQQDMKKATGLKATLCKDKIYLTLKMSYPSYLKQPLGY